MPNRKYFVICEDNCKFESMTKEQIIAAITQAVNDGNVGDIDAGFITTVKEQNAGKGLTFWIGTTAEYNAIPDDDKNADCLYIKTDDTFETDYIAALAELEKTIAAVAENPTFTPEIHIDVIPDTTVKCTYADGEIIPLTLKGDRTYIGKVKQYGEIKIETELFGYKKTVTYNIDAVRQHKTTVHCVDSTFSKNSWATIVHVCKNGIAPEDWQVGASKDDITILGKYHDVYEYDDEPKYAPLTLGVRSTKAGVGPDIDWTQMHNIQLGAGYTWGDTDMRNIVLPKFKQQHLERITDTESGLLLNAIRTVIKNSNIIGETVLAEAQTNDQLFLLSAQELGLAAVVDKEYGGYEHPLYNHTYERFKNGAGLFFVDGGVQDFWTRGTGEEHFLVAYNDNGKMALREEPETYYCTYYIGFCL